MFVWDILNCTPVPASLDACTIKTRRSLFEPRTPLHFDMSDDSSFEDYDLAEFSSDELNAVDHTIQHLSTRTFTYADVSYDMQVGRVQADILEYGPAGHLSSSTLFISTNSSRQTPAQLSPSVSTVVHESPTDQHVDMSVTSGGSETNVNESAASVSRQSVVRPSPYTLYRAWRKVLTVSDLVGPMW